MRKTLVFLTLFIFTIMTVAQTSQSPPSPKPEFTYTGKIQEARQLLANVQLKHSNKIASFGQYYKVRVRIKGRWHVKYRFVGYKDYAWKEAGLSIMNRASGNIKIIKIKKQGADLISLDDDFDVNFEMRFSGLTWNGKNNAFEISDLNSPELKWVVIGEKWIQKYDGAPADYVFYVPYSRTLHNPELVKRGDEHFDRKILLARQGLDILNVYSLAIPGKKITEVIPAAFIKRRGIVEHTDPTEAEAFWNKLLKENPFERVLVRLGTGGDSEFSDISSKAEARGMQQFIRSTWNMVDREYPAAQLPDFITGTADQVQSLKATMLLDDRNMRELVERLGPAVLQDKDLELYLAAAYNGGTGQHKKARGKRRLGLLYGLSYDRANWRDYIMPETVDYLEKLEYLIAQDKKETLKTSLETK